MLLIAYVNAESGATRMRQVVYMGLKSFETKFFIFGYEMHFPFNFTSSAYPESEQRVTNVLGKPRFSILLKELVSNI